MTILTTKDYKTHLSASPSVSSDIARISNWFGEMLNNWAQKYIAYRERQIALAALSRFSDIELKDIGLTRGELDAAVAGLHPDPARVNQVSSRAREQVIAMRTRTPAPSKSTNLMLQDTTSWR